MKISSFIAITALGLLLFAPNTGAHELQDNRATLVLRDNTHLAITLFIAYDHALHLALAPKHSFQEFLLVYSAMKPQDLQKELLRAQAKFQSETRLHLSPGGEVALTNWIWPDAKQVQTLLQRRVMQAIVDPVAVLYDEPVEIHADANSQQEITSLHIVFPEEFQRVLVVSYRPSQLWVEPESWSSAIKF